MSSLLDLPFDEALARSAPGHLLAESLAAIAARDARVKAFLYVHDPSAEVGPRSLPAGGLNNLPMAIKDNIVTRGMPTTCASRILRGFVSPFEATAVGRLRERGVALVGKTNLDEFAMGSSTEHSAMGATRNPWDLSRVPGGSSGGSAAAVAARMVPAALGSETGGSVRQPAALCGVVGVKPTYGRVSRNGLVAFASGLDQIGIVTKSVREAALLLGAIAGHDPLDSTSSPRPVDDYTADLELGARGLRLGIVREAVEQLGGEVRANFDAAVALLRDAGAVVSEVSIPTIGYAIAVYYIVANAEASANLSRFDGIRYGHRSERAVSLSEVYDESRGEGFGDEVKRRIMLGTFALSSGYYDAYYGRAQRVRARLRHDFDQAFRDFDCLITPTTPEPAFAVGAKTGDPLSMYLSDIFTAPANLVGIPAIAVPSGFSRERLPLSLQLMAPHFAERTMFRAAAAYERETQFWREAPVLG
ncbi:MAG: Asp-tRNA(Asn)/Glu-tRNA(Gln) amidotransferase subunit GatA [Acidobacteriota bacterium]